MTRDELRDMTEQHVVANLMGLAIDYMTIYDLYYSDESIRDSAFFKDLMDVVLQVSIILEVYIRDNQISSKYAIEKHKNIRRIIDTNIKYYESKGNS